MFDYCCESRPIDGRAGAIRRSTLKLLVFNLQSQRIVTSLFLASNRVRGPLCRVTGGFGRVAELHAPERLVSAHLAIMSWS